MAYSMDDLARRLQLSRELLSAYERPELTGEWLGLRLGGPGRHLEIPFPPGLAPTPRHNPPANPTDPFPRADVIVFTYSVDEAKGVADVMTPSRFSPDWSQYTRNFDRYLPHIRPGAPAFRARRLASYWQTRIDDKDVLVVQSDLHMHQDAMLVQGRPSLPLLELFAQLLAESQPSYFFSVGAASSVYPDRALGTVVASRAVQFDCQNDFRNEPFARALYRSEWALPEAFLGKGLDLMQPLLASFATDGANAIGDGCGPCRDHAPPAPATLLVDGADAIPAFHPVLTTDFFEFGTADNHLGDLGMAVESGDAVMGLAVSQAPSPPKWASVRGYAESLIDGKLLPRDRETRASRTFLQHAYGASVLAAVAAWSFIAGL